MRFLDLIPHEFKERWLTGDRYRGLALSIAAVIIIISTSSELWPLATDSLFNIIISISYSWVIPLSFTIFLFLLYLVDYYRIVNKKTGRVIILALICTILDITLIYTFTYLSYAILFGLSISIESFSSQWNLLYLILPVIIGEFTLSTRASSQLETARRLHKDAQDLLQEIRRERKLRADKEKEKGVRPKLPDLKELE